MSTNNKE
jgi:multiple RNA-binding domain-containing protein 1